MCVCVRVRACVCVRVRAWAYVCASLALPGMISDRASGYQAQAPRAQCLGRGRFVRLQGTKGCWRQAPVQSNPLRGA